MFSLKWTPYFNIKSELFNAEFQRNRILKIPTAKISTRGSLMPAEDGSALLSDTLSPTRQWGREKSAPRPYETDPFRWHLSSTLLT